MARFRKCPLCGASVKIENLDQHARKAHPGKKVSWKLTATEQLVVAEARRRPPMMGRRERLLYPVVGIVIVIAIIVGVIVLAPPQQPTGPEVAPNFTLMSSDGESVRLWDLQGSVLLLDFMDTHCSHCREDTPAVLRPLHAAYGDRVVFLSVDVGFIGPPDDFDDIRNFKTTFGASWTYVLDDGSVAPQYGVGGTPTIFILREDLSVHSRHSGNEVALSTLSPALDSALGGG